MEDDVYESLSGVEKNGESQRITFTTECRVQDRFDKSISKNKIINFEAKNKKKVKINGKVQEIRIQRDVFGRLLYASLENDIDLEKALSYPNAPISFSLCHADGNICKTKKSVITTELLKYQEADVTVENSDIHIIDGFYLLHTLKNVPGKYGKISEYILKKERLIEKWYILFLISLRNHLLKITSMTKEEMKKHTTILTETLNVLQTSANYSEVKTSKKNL